MSGIRRRLLGSAATWIVVLGVVALAVHPERCPAVTAAAARQAAARAVAWFGANVGDDGRFTYRFDRDRRVVEPGYNEPRHAGVLLSLYQAESAGVSGAARIAEIGLRFVDDRTRQTGWGTMFGEGPVVSTGAQALLVAALDERRQALGRSDRDELMLALGETLVATVADDGAIEALVDSETGPVIGSRNRYFTGEVLWALSRLELAFPGRGYRDAALRVRRYLIEDRDEVERPVPQLSDHWGAYSWETMSRWPDPPPIGPGERAWLDRQLGLFGLQVRYESQRVGGITSLTRGDHALAAGLGTLGEGIGSYLAWSDRSPALSEPDRADLVERARCVVGLLVERQVSAADLTDHDDPSRVVGAWFRQGDTQMDDQQHSLSALVLLADRLEG